MNLRNLTLRAGANLMSASARPRVPKSRPTGDPDLPLLRISDVCQWLQISKPTLWRLRRDADFPEPIEISERAIGWPREEIQSWLDSRRRCRTRAER
jgi:prophage regulatory protein